MAEEFIISFSESDNIDISFTENSSEFTPSFGEVVQVETSDAVKYTPQTLTDAQKLQARTNIGPVVSSATFTQGSKAALSTTDISYVESGLAITVDEDEEELIFSNVPVKSAKSVNTFTANGNDIFTTT